MKNLLFRTTLFFLLMLSPTVCLGVRPPLPVGDCLKLGPGEYLYAEDNPSLDKKLRDNFAIEFWFYLESVPQFPFQQKVLFAKPGSFAVLAYTEGRLSPLINGLLMPMKSSRIRVVGIREDGFQTKSITSAEAGKWHHVVFYTIMVGESRHREVRLDGKHISGGRGTPGGIWCTDSDSRFYVGHVPPEIWEEWKEDNVLPYDPIVCSPTYLDELRISNARRDGIDPWEQPHTDSETMALWHFDEGAKSTVYRDESKHQNTLRRVSLNVNKSGLLSTSWGAIKRITN